MLIEYRLLIERWDNEMEVSLAPARNGNLSWR